MSTLKVINVIHPSGSTNNLVNDASGNVTAGGTIAMASSFLRNRIINGDMRIDQRNAGASQTITAAAALAYTVDRWYAYCTGANVTGQRVAGTAPAQYAYKFTGATSNTLVGFGQRIEQLNSYDLASGAVTISAHMTASTNTTITWYLYAPTSTADTFGTIASPTVTQIATGTFSVTTTRTQFTATISAETMSGYNKGLELRFVAASGLGNAVTWTTELVQLEVGSVATPFERRLYGQELALCQRYYARLGSLSGNYVGFGAGMCDTTSTGFIYIKYPVTMRGTPTLAQSNTAVYSTTAAFATSSVGTTYYGGDSLAANINVTGTMSIGRGATLIGNNNSSAYVELSAEL